MGHGHVVPEVARAVLLAFAAPQVHRDVHDLRVLDCAAQSRRDHIVGRQELGLGREQLQLLLLDRTLGEQRHAALARRPADLLREPAQRAPAADALAVSFAKGHQLQAEPCRAVPLQRLHFLMRQQRVQLAHQVVQGLGVPHQVRQVHHEAHEGLFKGHEFDQKDLGADVQRLDGCQGIHQVFLQAFQELELTLEVQRRNQRALLGTLGDAKQGVVHARLHPDFALRLLGASRQNGIQLSQLLNCRLEILRQGPTDPRARARGLVEVVFWSRV